MDKAGLIVITGANRGIGFTILEQILLNPSNKSNLLLTSRNPQFGQEALESLATKHPNAKSRLFYHQLDITSSSSITSFTKWLASEFGSLDILVNNAGIGSRKDSEDINYRIPPEEARDTANTNFFGTVDLTHSLLPLLSPQGKVVMVSSNFGQLLHQGESARKFLEDPTLTKEKLYKEMENVVEYASKHKLPEMGYSKQIYNVTKAFLNAHVRWVLPQYLKDDQTCFACNPGWVRTRLGGSEAFLSVEEGTTSVMRVINADLKESKLLSGKYLDEKGEVDSF